MEKVYKVISINWFQNFLYILWEKPLCW